MNEEIRTKSRSRTTRRMAVLGAGPIGLEAALEGTAEGFDVAVFDAGDVAHNVRQWGHVVLFTPFAMNRSERGVRTLRAERPDRPLPSGGDFLSGRDYAGQYLLPLSECSLLKGRVHTGCRVIAVGRTGLLKHEAVGRARREATPFRLLIESGGAETIVEADIVIDATGTYGHANYLGDGAIPAAGERAAREHISYMLDDVLGAHRNRYAGRRIALIGAGYSAATSVVALRRLVDDHPATSVVWLTRAESKAPIREIQNDRLAARLHLARRANRIAAEMHPRITHYPGASICRLDQADDGTLRIQATVGGRPMTVSVDRILANVGYRPDRSLYEQLQVHECYATMGPMRLAASLAGEGAVDCLDRQPAPAETLLNPEPNFFIIGSKSYGRDSTFLLQNGLRQVEQVFSLLGARCPGCR